VAVWLAAAAAALRVALVLTEAYRYHEICLAREAVRAAALRATA